MHPTCLTCGRPVEEGATSPSIAMAQRLADLYRIPLDEIAFYT